jgi:hypothetical protein
MNLINNENKTKLIGLLTILVIFWLVLYFIPEILISLLNTLLGNLILIIIIILIYSNNKIYGLISFLILILLLRLNKLSLKEFFTQKSELDFLTIQDTINRNKIFDMNIINKQASQEEIDYFNKNGIWPWSQEVIKLYEEAIIHNPYIRTIPEDATNYARKIYNESAIIRILTYQSKEGQFLLNGVLINDLSNNNIDNLPSGFGDFGYTSHLIGNKTNDIIKCNFKNDINPTLERITYTGKGDIFNQQTKKITQVDYNDLEKLIPGFSFLSSPCNPCKSMLLPPDYSCTYRLNIKNKSPFISKIWQYLWGINDNPLISQPSFLTENVNSNEFPLLSELQSELQKENYYRK